MAKQKNKLPAKTQQHMRMNFLSQAASLMAILSNPLPQQQTTTTTKVKQRDHIHCRSFRKNLTWQQDLQGYHGLSRYYNTTMKKIGQRVVLRLDPHLKRSICKRCSTSLIPALTSTVRIQSRPETTTVTKCNVCGEEKGWVARPGYQLFSDRRDVHYNRSTSDDDDEEEEDQPKQDIYNTTDQDTPMTKRTMDGDQTITLG